MTSRRSAVTLYSDATSLASHSVRLMLAEKGIDSEWIDVNPLYPPDDLLHLNPQGSLPTIVDRELALYDARVIIDYLDERYPHPPMMPTDPVSRARTRLTLYRIRQDWYSLIDAGHTPGSRATLDEAEREQLTRSLAASADVFAAMPFFLSEEFSIVDATVAPLLWRLPCYGIVLPSSAAPVNAYARRIFARAGFQASLTRQEREMNA